MRRRIAAGTVAALAITASLTSMRPMTVGAQTGAPYCRPGQAPAFILGIGALHDRLGDLMGEPLECEHVDAASGDTIQHTTTGHAYYRPEINTAIFTNGEAHWALSHGQLVLWRGPSPTPPQPTSSETTYIDVTMPLRGRVDALQERLARLRVQAEGGQLATVNVAELSELIGELTRVRQAFAAADESERLEQYDGLMMRSLDEALAAAGQLFRARTTDVPEARAAFVAEAAGHRSESERLQREANDAYSQALPIVVG